MKNWKAAFHSFRISSLFRKRFYRRSLVLVLLAICLPTIAVGSGVKWIGTRQMEKIVLSSRQHQVAQTAVRLDDSLSFLEKAATQWAFNPEFGLKLKNLETQYDYEFIRSIYTNLLLLKESNPLIEQADIYLDRPGVVYSDSSGTLALGDDDKLRFHELLNNPQTAFWLPRFLPAANTGAGKETLTLIYQLPASSDVEPFGALLVQVNRGQVSRMLSGSTLDENSAAFLFDDSGQPIGSSTEKAQSLQLQSGLIERIGSSGKAGGSLIYEADRSMYSVTYTVFKRLGKYWTYASVDSLEKINSPVVAASNFVYLFGGAGLLLAIAVAFLVSRKLYQPIHTLNKMFGIHLSPGSESADEVEFITEQWKHLNFQSRALEDRLQKQLPVMKEGFLLQLLQGHFQLSRPDELKERMQLFGWNTERPGYAVLGIQMTGSPQSKERFHKGDQELISFAAVNMVEEVLKDRELRSEIINLHDLSIGVILEYPPDESPDGRRNDLQLLAERLVDIIYQFLQMPTTLCISRPIETVTEIPQAWEEVNRLVRYRNLYDSKQVIQAEDFMPQLNDGIRYPFAAESELMQAIRNLDEKLAAQVLETFCSELEANTTKEYLFQQGLLQLLGNLRFGMLKAGYNPFETEPFSLQEELDRGIETSEIAALLRERVISPYIRKIRQESEDQDSRLKLTIERIVETIHSRYGNADLSLDMLADEHELTPLTLSKAFKKITGINFVTYVTDVRLNKSKQLLLETDCKINDIAEMVGYQPTYFNRIFKKSEGITPSRYREMMQVEGQRPEL